MPAHKGPRVCNGPAEVCMRAYVVLDRGTARHPHALPCGVCAIPTTVLRWDLDLSTHVCIRCDPLSGRKVTR